MRENEHDEPEKTFYCNDCQENFTKPDYLYGAVVCPECQQPDIEHWDKESEKG